MEKIISYLRFIKFEHSLFALPFALMAVVYSNSDGGSIPLLLVICCMVLARSAAMGFNRIVDRNLDGLNKRTSERELVTGLIKLPHAIIFVIVCILGFIICTAFLNKLAFILSPVALIIILSYSFSKRFTWLCHFHLGLSLGMAPVAAWIGVTERMDMAPVVLGLGVTMWVAGFDIIYAFLDIEFDRLNKIHSVPSKFGAEISLVIVRILHTLSFMMFLLFGYLLDVTHSYYVGLLIAAGLLLVQNYKIRALKPEAINSVFFNLNALVGVVLLLFSVIERELRHIR